MKPLSTHTELLAQLQIDGAELNHLVRTRNTFYTRRIIRRRSRSRPRVVYEVRDGLRRVQRVIAIMLREDLERMDSCVTGFRSGGSIAKHALPHCGATMVAVADIKSFFASITEDRVWDLFISLGIATNVAMTLARLTTLNGSLPEGTKVGPAIANLVGRDLDTRVQGDLPKDCSYTRYADDLAFSGIQIPSKTDVAGWIEAAGFSLKEGSYRVRDISQGPYVTGLFVGDKAPRVPKKRRRMIERTLFYMAKGNHERALMEMKTSRVWKSRSNQYRLAGLKGLIDGVGAVEPTTATQYRNQLSLILGNQ